MFKREVLSIDEILKRTLRNNGLETPMLQTRLLASWEKIAGPIAKRYTTDKYIRNQTLYVKLSSPALRSDLSMMKTELVRKLNAEVGASIIVDIKFC